MTTTTTTAPVSAESTTVSADSTPKPASLIAQHPDVVAAAAALKQAKAAAAAALKPATPPKAPAKKKSDSINFDVKEVFSVKSIGRFVSVEMVPGNSTGLESGLYFVSGYVGTRGRDGNGTMTFRDRDMGEVSVDWRTVLDDAHNGANPLMLSAEVVCNLSKIGEFFQPTEFSASVEIGTESEMLDVCAPVSTELVAPALMVD